MKILCRSLLVTDVRNEGARTDRRELSVIGILATVAALCVACRFIVLFVARAHALENVENLAASTSN